MNKTYLECRQYQTCNIVGENALQCFKQAKYIDIARDAGLKVKFEQEEGYWFDYIPDFDSVETWNRRFDKGTHEVLFGYVQDDAGEVLASLGGIVVSCDQDGRDYLHAIELELIYEAAMHLLRGA